MADLQSSWNGRVVPPVRNRAKLPWRRTDDVTSRGRHVDVSFDTTSARSMDSDGSPMQRGHWLRQYDGFFGALSTAAHPHLLSESGGDPTELRKCARRDVSPTLLRFPR